MKSMYGLEIQCTDDSPQYFQNLLLQMKHTTSIFDVDDNLLITGTAMEAKLIKNILADRCLLEETYMLIRLENPTKSDLFSDYGFTTTKENHYLYQNMISVFQIVSGKQEEISMALIQMDESIIAIEEQYKKLYFIDKNSQTFIEKVAQAYDIEVSFLDLDK